MKTAFNNLKSNLIFLLLCGLTMLLLARGTLYALPEVLWAALPSPPQAVEQTQAASLSQAAQ